MSIPSFETNKLKSRRKAIIDGHTFYIRRMSNIERLEVLRLNEEVEDIISKYPADVADKDIKPEDIKHIQDNSRKSSEVLISLFDDGTETKEKSRALVSSLDEDDISHIINSVFNQTEVKEDVEA